MLAPEQDINDWDKSNWFMTPILKHADFKPLASIPNANVKTKISRKDDTITVTLENKSANVAFFNRLAALNPNGMLYAPAWWDDNYFSLRPGEKKTVNCKLPTSADAVEARITLDGWNVSASEITQ